MMPTTHCTRCGVRLVHFQRPVGSGLVENSSRCPACSFFEAGAVEPGLIESDAPCLVRICIVSEVTVAQLRALRMESAELAHQAPADLRTTGCAIGPY